MFLIKTQILNSKHPNFVVYISYRQIEQCAEIAFLAGQNAKNEYKQTHKEQVQYWRFLKLITHPPHSVGLHIFFPRNLSVLCGGTVIL
jgi:hypothetical protein